MKKLFALLMVCGFAVAFVACGGGNKEAAEKAKADSVAAAAKADSIKAVEAAAAAEAAAKVKADSTRKADSVAALAPKKK
jgi:hypothetical protein